MHGRTMTALHRALVAMHCVLITVRRYRIVAHRSSTAVRRAAMFVSRWSCHVPRRPYTVPTTLPRWLCPYGRPPMAVLQWPCSGRAPMVLPRWLHAKALFRKLLWLPHAKNGALMVVSRIHVPKTCLNERSPCVDLRFPIYVFPMVSPMVCSDCRSPVPALWWL